MAHRRADVVDRAIAVLDAEGLAALSMRRVAADLGVQVGALYHHLANKDALLASMADEILARGRRAAEVVTWDAELRLVCVELRDAMLAHRDGAALIAEVHARGTGATEPEHRMYDVLRRSGADEHLARVGARTLLHYVFGHAADAQADRAAGRGGVPSDDFATGLGLVLDGLSGRLEPRPGR